jgi:hypothetical protein
VNLYGKDPLKDIGVEGGIILKYISRILGVGWIGLTEDRAW